MMNSATQPIPVLDASAVIDAICATSGEGFRPSLKSEIASAKTKQGLQILLQMYVIRFRLRDDFELVGYEPHWSSGSAVEAEQLAGLGYTDIRTVSDANHFSSSAILIHSISADRFRAINVLLDHYSMPKGSSRLMVGWELEALLMMSPDFLIALTQEPAGDRFELYSRLALAADPSRYDRLALSRELGLNQRELIEAFQHPVALLIGLRDAMPDQYKNPWYVLETANTGHNAASVKKWGARLSMKFSAGSLGAIPGKPAAIKSLLGRGGITSLAEVTQFLEAGFTKGGDLKSLRTMMGADATLADLAEARDTLPVDVLEEWARANRGKLTIDEVRAITDLNLAGFKTAKQVIAAFGDTHHQSRLAAGTETSPLRLFANLATAGMTSSRLRVLARAGIPVTEAAKFQQSTTEWEGGAPFREVYRANQARQVESGWKAKVDPWEFTSATFRVGHAQ